MKKIVNKDVTAVAFEGLEQRQFFAATPMTHVAPPAFGDAGGMHPPIVFDAAFASAGRFPQGVGNPGSAFDNQAGTSPAAVATASTAAASTATFNGYPTSPASVAVVSIASGSMELVNRAVDGDFVTADTAHTDSLIATARADTTLATATPAALASDSSTTVATTSTPATPELPDGQLVHPAAVFSTEPIRGNAEVGGVSTITASLRSAEQEIACVVRLAWADIAYTNVGQTIGRLADEAGRALSRNAADAELAAAMVMGVAGAAWWARQVNDGVAEKKVEAEQTWIETVYPRPLAG